MAEERKVLRRKPSMTEMKGGGIYVEEEALPEEKYYQAC
jgi:hypothetical protein